MSSDSYVGVRFCVLMSILLLVLAVGVNWLIQLWHQFAR